MLRRSVLLTMVAAGLAVTGTEQALAQACEGRPGASAIEQYCEAIPDATGDRVTPGDGNSSTGNGSGSVPQSTSGELNDAGGDGQAVLGLVASGGGSDGGSDGSSGGDSSSGGASGGSSSSTSGTSPGDAGNQVSAAQPPGDNPLRAVSSAVSTGATVGSGFVWGLLALTLAAVTAGWVGFRHRRSPS